MRKYVEAFVVRMRVLVLYCAAQCEFRVIIVWKEVWWEGARYVMVSWVWTGVW